MTALELAANALTTISILLAGRNSIHTWWTGIVGCALFALLFHGAQLYADVALQAFFIVSSAVGWWHWHADRVTAERPVRHASGAQIVAALAIAAAGTAAYGFLLHRFTDAYAPYPDSAVLAFSVVALVLLVQRRIETWPLWLVVNTIAVPLYASRGLWLTAALYAAYWINAVVSWRHWLVLARPAAAGPAPATAGSAG